MFELTAMWLVLGLATLGADAARAARRRFGPHVAPIVRRARDRAARLRARIDAYREARRPPPMLPPARIAIRRGSWFDRFQAGPDD
jgi:hypothetical protein